MKKSLLFCLFLAFQFIVPAQSEVALRKKFNIDSNGIGLQGYDAISYFTSSKPRIGKKEFSYTYKGIIYYFESVKTLNVFKVNPEKWVPVYGGWCAYAMGESGERVEVDPLTFKIIDNKLYLFYNAYFTNTLPKWNRDEKNLKTKADLNWSKFISK